jgi:hypothetical protein
MDDNGEHAQVTVWLGRGRVMGGSVTVFLVAKIGYL